MTKIYASKSTAQGQLTKTAKRYPEKSFVVVEGNGGWMVQEEEADGIDAAVVDAQNEAAAKQALLDQWKANESDAMGTQEADIDGPMTQDEKSQALDDLAAEVIDEAVSPRRRRRKTRCAPWCSASSS